ncbi:MAG: hypothetical protein QOK42_1899 [Frankiaceae bacterium]|jgi:hypothetical protein|nr:hypothetical protein [Frankiaceae bacterium]MDX6225809.1 hypothetical protein [Frankiales bacterium]MDX6274724.1 hypothetical protein [Frankiales bacterium]
MAVTSALPGTASRTDRRELVASAAVLTWVPLVLGIDSRVSAGSQVILGVATWLLLIMLLRRESGLTRAQVVVVVLFATAVEYTFSAWLGVYRYRHGGVAAYVPPGHGLVYLCALDLGRSTLFRAHRRAVLAAALTGCGGYAAWGLLLADRTDVLGAFWFGCLAAFCWKGKQPLVYAGAFVVVTYLELLGTRLGCWTWSLHDPTGWIPIGNPPSGAAGGYGWFDAAALAFAPALVARWERRREPVSE